MGVFCCYYCCPFGFWLWGFFLVSKGKGYISDYRLVTEISCKMHSTQTLPVTTPVRATGPSVSAAERGCDEPPLRSGATCAPTTRLLLFEHLPPRRGPCASGSGRQAGAVGPGATPLPGEADGAGSAPGVAGARPRRCGYPRTSASHDRRDAAAAAVSVIMANTSRRSAGPAHAAARPVPAAF